MTMKELKELATNILPPHHRATVTWLARRFDNPWPTWEDRTFWDVMRWNRERKAAKVPSEGHLIGNVDPTEADYQRAFPQVPVDSNALSNPPPNTVQALWVGHSTVLVQMEGLALLTDPIFAERCSPLSFIGPKRVRPPALTIDDAAFPDLDAVLISHNHYDHLCKHSVKKLHDRFGSRLKWFVPLGLASWFTRRSIRNVVELDWWEEFEFKGVRMVFTPAQHWSMRGLLDRKSTLWGGWAVIGPKLRFWFAGDTGYAPVFKEIGERLGPFDLSAIPIGAYSPRWFLRPQHIDPAEAVFVHKDVQSKRSMAIHVATFPLTDEPLDEPIALLGSASQEANLHDGEFVALCHGAMLATADGHDLFKPLQIPIPNKIS